MDDVLRHRLESGKVPGSRSLLPCGNRSRGQLCVWLPALYSQTHLPQAAISSISQVLAPTQRAGLAKKSIRRHARCRQGAGETFPLQPKQSRAVLGDRLQRVDSAASASSRDEADALLVSLKRG